MNRRKVLIFTRYYLPGYRAGGPIRSISNLVEWIGDNIEFRVVTTNKDFFQKTKYENINHNDWNTLGNCQVFYLDERSVKLSKLLDLHSTDEYDLIYINSFFDLEFSIIPVLMNRFFLKNKILLAPRGEFSDGALEIKSLKKRLYIRLVKMLGIYKKVNWHVTGDNEKKDLLKNFRIKKNQIFVASNLPSKKKVEVYQTVKKNSNEVKLIYISRVTPKKNLLFAIQSLISIKSINIQFDIFGTIDDENYWKRCKDEINKLPTAVKVSYKGALPHEKVMKTLSGYHLFYMPTRGENFGHAIYESLLAGTPVLISDQTPWRDLQRKNMGWDLPLNRVESFKEVIETIAKMDEEEMNQLKRIVRKSIQTLSVDQSVQQNLDLFEELLS